MPVLMSNLNELHVTVRYALWCVTFIVVAYMLLNAFTVALRVPLHAGGAAAGGVSPPSFPALAAANVSVHVSALPPVQVVDRNVSVTTGGKCVRINDTYRCFE